MLHHAGRQIKTLRREGRQLSLAVHQGRQIYPGKKPSSWLLPQLETMVLEDAGEKWFQVTFDAAMPLTGSAASGWTDPAGQYGIRLQRSDDLQAWDYDLIGVTGYPINHGDGTYTYAARCKYPIDSDIKTGNIWTLSNARGGDSRNNPFTALVLGGVVQALPHFPYTMPTHAALLQTDLRALGWSGATVVATSDVDWRIDIPTLSLTDRYAFGKIFWPLYLVPDMFGNVVNPCDGAAFLGQFTNAAGVRTSIARQFVRLAFTHLSPP